MCKVLLKYGSAAVQQLMAEFFTPRIPTLLSRFLDNLCVPLVRDNELLPSEKDRVEATLSNLATYADLVSLSVQMIHLN